MNPSLSVHAQLLSSTVQNFMWALLLWAACNILVAGIFFFQKKSRPFWTMMGLWNVASLCFCIFVLVQTQRMALPVSTAGIVQLFSNTGTFAALSLALNVSYILTGILLVREGQHVKRNRLKAFGVAIIIQGAFLLCFDLILFATLRSLSHQFFSIL